MLFHASKILSFRMLRECSWGFEFLASHTTNMKNTSFSVIFESQILCTSLTWVTQQSEFTKKLIEGPKEEYLLFIVLEEIFSIPEFM